MAVVEDVRWHGAELERSYQERALYDSMVRVVVSPTWVRLNDFQRSAPRAVERLIQPKQN